MKPNNQLLADMGIQEKAQELSLTQKLLFLADNKFDCRHYQVEKFYTWYLVFSVWKRDDDVVVIYKDDKMYALKLMSNTNNIAAELLAAPSITKGQHITFGVIEHAIQVNKYLFDRGECVFLDMKKCCVFMYGPTQELFFGIIE